MRLNNCDISRKGNDIWQSSAWYVNIVVPSSRKQKPIQKKINIPVFFYTICFEVFGFLRRQNS